MKRKYRKCMLMMLSLATAAVLIHAGLQPPFVTHPSASTEQY